MPRRHRRWTIEALRIAVASEISLAGVLRGIGLRPAGGNYENVSRSFAAMASRRSIGLARGICEVGTTACPQNSTRAALGFATLHTTATNCAVD